MDVEICINSDDSKNLHLNVANAWEGGAARIELCSTMQVDGLTPSPESIAIARTAFQNRAGLMVMIRPRGGDFFFSSEETALMLRHIKMAAQQGADGVVVGVLRKIDGGIDVSSMNQLLQTARDNGLAVTFHRAIDATPDPLSALDVLAKVGVDRVLSSGVRWGGAGGAIAGIDMLNKMAARAGRAEIIVCSGVGPDNARRIVEGIASGRGMISLHSYSGVLKNGIVSADAVRTLVERAQPHVG